MLNRYKNSDDMIAHLAPEESVYCICDSALEKRARWFVENFEGDVLYAFKANPIRAIVDALYKGGIRHFDTASIKEISTINEWYDDGHTYFMHPVKGLKATAVAWHNQGVRHFVVDHLDEIEKFHQILPEAGMDAILIVRMATPSDDATFNLSSKFGVAPEGVVELMRAITSRGIRTGLCFHVGSQCVTTKGHAVALDITKSILDLARGEGIEIACLDVGGGFPAPYPTGATPPPLQDYLDVVSAGVNALSLPNNCPVMCEPGRALVAEGMSVVTQVTLRKEGSLYLSDGTHGTFGGVKLGLKFPVRAIRPNAMLSTETTPFTIFGPTCDSTDIFPYQMQLPKDIATGDWLELGLLGAYGPAVASDFNGFKPNQFCYVDEGFDPDASTVYV